MMRTEKKITVCAAEEGFEEKARALADALGTAYLPAYQIPGNGELLLSAGPDGLRLEGQGLSMKGDLLSMIPRIREANLRRELLIKASGISRRGSEADEKQLLAVDATAGMGEDALLLSAAGFRVRLYEKDPVIAALLKDSLERAEKAPELKEVIARMELIAGDSIAAMEQMEETPDVILLDPMFPERKKSGLVKKKFQLLHYLEEPCEDEEALLQAAISADPGRIVIKRPLKGPFLCGLKPDFSMPGNSVRYDCLLKPFTGDKYKKKR